MKTYGCTNERLSISIFRHFNKYESVRREDSFDTDIQMYNKHTHVHAQTIEQKDTPTDRQTLPLTNNETNKQTNKETNKQTNRQSHGQIDKMRNTRTDRQNAKHTDR